MVWGYEKGFVVEHVERGTKRITCRDCKRYNKEDKSCSKASKYLPEDGYDSWKYCRFFKLSGDAKYYKEKKQQLQRKQQNSKPKVKEESAIPSNQKLSDEKREKIVFHLGMPIKHEKFGYGKIIYIDEKRIMIKFLDNTTRTFNVEYCTSNMIIKKIRYSEYRAAKG